MKIADFLFMKTEMYDESGEISAYEIAEGVLMIAIFLRFTDDYLIYMMLHLHKVWSFHSG